MTKKMYTKTTITEEPRLTIRYDENSDSPREWSNLGYFITKDRNYHSPDKNETLERIIAETGDVASDQADHIKLIKERAGEEFDEKILAVYPVAKYEHSGVSYSLGTAHGFDYSNNGFYIITDKSQAEAGTEEKNWESTIKSEIDTYNKYANGEVFGFTLYNEAGELEDSCYGFYDINDIKDYLPEEWKDEDLSDYFIN